MFKKTYQATHPSMIDGISNEALCDLYQVTDLFVADVGGCALELLVDARPVRTRV